VEVAVRVWLPAGGHDLCGTVDAAGDDAAQLGGWLLWRWRTLITSPVPGDPNGRGGSVDAAFLAESAGDFERWDLDAQRGAYSLETRLRMAVGEAFTRWLSRQSATIREVASRLRDDGMPVELVPSAAIRLSGER
jgi:hypothetical protein